MTRPERDQSKALAQPNAKASKHRVLQWLHQQHGQHPPAAPRAAAAGPQPSRTVLSTAAYCHDGHNGPPAACGGRAVAVNDIGSLHKGADNGKTSARKKAAQLWKKWKSAMGMNGSKSILSVGLTSKNSSSTKLSQGLLQRHQEEQEYLIDSPTKAPLTILYGSLASRSRGLKSTETAGSVSEAADINVIGASQPISPTAAAVSAAAAGMPGNVVRAFNSSLYEQAAPPRTPLGTTPRNSSNELCDAAATPAVSATVEADWSQSNSATTGGHAAAAAAWATAIGAPSVMAASKGTTAAAGHAPLVAQASCGSGTSSVLSPKTPSGHSPTTAELKPGAGSMPQEQSPTFTAGTVICQQHNSLVQERTNPSTSPWQPANSQLPSQPMPTAVRSSTRLQGGAHPGQTHSGSKLLGTALTAYPAVAAEVVRSGLGRGCGVHAATGVDPPAGDNFTASWHAPSAAHAGNSFCWHQEPAVGQKCADVSSVSSMADGTVHVGAAGADTDVAGWQLRAALLEDELQGRALEVQELLQQLADRRTAVQAALSSMQGGRATQRHRATLELSAISSSAKQLTGRAAALGSGLSVLQGCQTVLGSSRGARLDPGSKVAVLQLVMSEVLNRLPEEELEQLEVCGGLPSLSLSKPHRPEGGKLDQARPGSIRLDQDGREVCRLAGVGPERLARVNSASSNCTNPHSRAAVSMYASATAYPALVSDGCAVVETCDTVCFDDEQHEQQQQQFRQEQQYWHRFAAADDDDDDDECSDDDESCSEDDDVITTLSSVLSSRHYTPRKSLSYETRKAGLAAARSGPWANALTASAPAVPWRGGGPRQQAAGNLAAVTATAGAGHRPRVDEPFEVSMLNSSSRLHPTESTGYNRDDARGRFWDQTYGAALPPAGPPRPSTGASLGSLMGPGPAGPASRRTHHASVPLRSSRAGSVAFSDVDSVYSVMSQIGFEGGLPAWPEESEECCGLEPFTAAAAGCDDLGGHPQQQRQQWYGGDDGRSSTTSCVTALSNLGGGHDDRSGHSISTSMMSAAAMHEARVQQTTYGAPAAGSGRRNAAAARVLASRSKSSVRGDPTFMVPAGSSTAAGLPSSVESAPLQQVLLSSVGAGETVDLNTMTVGDLLRALTQAVVGRQFN